MPLGTPLIYELNYFNNINKNSNRNLNNNFTITNRKVNLTKTYKNRIIINNTSKCVRKISDFNYIF